VDLHGLLRRKKDPRDMTPMERQMAIAKSLSKKQIQLTHPELTPEQVSQAQKNIKRMQA
jgi:hypothetical protein